MGFDVEQMLINLQTSLNPLYKLGTATAYLLGIMYAFKALYSLKVYGELRTMMASRTSFKDPMYHLVIAGMLLYLPTGFSVIMNTTFGYSNVLAYDQFPSSDGRDLSVAAQVILEIVQVIGIYAFVRGWVLLARSAGEGGQQGLFGKGIVHVFGGVFGINIVGTFNVIASTFGITF